jgi:hypothetical protein
MKLFELKFLRLQVFRRKPPLRLDNDGMHLWWFRFADGAKGFRDI